MKKTNSKIIDGAMIIPIHDVLVRGTEVDESMTIVFLHFASLFGYYGGIFVVDYEYAKLLKDGVYPMDSLIDTPAQKLIEVAMDSGDMPVEMHYELGMTAIAVEIHVSNDNRFYDTLRLFLAPKFNTGELSLKTFIDTVFGGFDGESLEDAMEGVEAEYVVEKENKSTHQMDIYR